MKSIRHSSTFERKNEGVSSLLKGETPSIKNSKSTLLDPSFFSGAISTSLPQDKDIFEWKLNAKHQIGLFVSKFYPDIQSSFEIISGNQNRLLYSKFRVKFWPLYMDSVNVLYSDLGGREQSAEWIQFDRKVAVIVILRLWPAQERLFIWTWLGESA